MARIHLRDQSKENQIGGVRGSTVVVLWTRVVRWISYRSSISIVASTLVAEHCGFARPFFGGDSKGRFEVNSFDPKSLEAKRSGDRGFLVKLELWASRHRPHKAP